MVSPLWVLLIHWVSCWALLAGARSAHFLHKIYGGAQLHGLVGCIDVANIACATGIHVLRYLSSDRFQVWALAGRCVLSTQSGNAGAVAGWLSSFTVWKLLDGGEPDNEPAYDGVFLRPFCKQGLIGNTSSLLRQIPGVTEDSLLSILMAGKYVITIVHPGRRLYAKRSPYNQF